jgi:hypothetical protein
LLLCKEGISNFGNIITICKTCLNSVVKNKTPKISLINGLWIGHTDDLLPKLTLVEEFLFARYRCKTTSKKLKYSNNSLTCQKT